MTDNRVTGYVTLAALDSLAANWEKESIELRETMRQVDNELSSAPLGRAYILHGILSRADCLERCATQLRAIEPCQQQTVYVERLEYVPIPATTRTGERPGGDE